MSIILDRYMEILRNKGRCIGTIGKGCGDCGKDLNEVCYSIKAVRGDVIKRGVKEIQRARLDFCFSKLLETNYAEKVFEEFL